MFSQLKGGSEEIGTVIPKAHEGDAEFPALRDDDIGESTLASQRCAGDSGQRLFDEISSCIHRLNILDS